MPAASVDGAPFDRGPAAAELQGGLRMLAEAT
jgi:hypothetical protein